MGSRAGVGPGCIWGRWGPEAPSHYWGARVYSVRSGVVWRTLAAALLAGRCIYLVLAIGAPPTVHLRQLSWLGVR